jgi:hypothetical protein
VLAGWEWDAGIEHRALAESNAAGAQLLKESGPLARLRITARPAWVGDFEFSAALAHAQLDYAGHTQAGAPLSTTSRHDEIEAGLRWRLLASSSWGQPVLTLDALAFRRAIAATPAVSSLTETSRIVMPGAGWRTPVGGIGAASLSFEARWRVSIAHRLHVDYAGLFDPSSLSGGRRNEASFIATAAWRSGWSLAFGAHRTRQRASATSPIYRGGVPAGTVSQPRISIDDFGLRLSKAF